VILTIWELQIVVCQIRPGHATARRTESPPAAHTKVHEKASKKGKQNLGMLLIRKLLLLSSSNSFSSAGSMYVLSSEGAGDPNIKGSAGSNATTSVGRAATRRHQEQHSSKKIVKVELNH